MTRTVIDSMGSLTVPDNAWWGAQTQRAVDNFAISGRRMPAGFLIAMLHIKSAAAKSNADLGLLDGDKAAAIQDACQQLLHAMPLEQFPVDMFQTGSGTSSNMNVNEVIATCCEQAGVSVHANDHVNLGQSSNDTVPTAIHVSAAVAVNRQLLPAIDTLMSAMDRHISAGETQIKTGRTHLMDAMPMTVGQEWQTWQAQLRHCREILIQSVDNLRAIPQGGTAVGTGINAHPQLAERIAKQLSDDTGMVFRPLLLPFVAQSSLDVPLQLSAALRGLAVVMTKLCNDLRWMNSGPLYGLGEVQMPAVQPGSSIMPGKVNPVICESALMVSAQVIGLDQANTVAAQSGNFQLNVMMPLVATNLLDMVSWLANSCSNLADKAINTLQINHHKLADGVRKNPVLVTALNPLVGYEKAAEIAKVALRDQRDVLSVAEEMTDIDRQTLADALDPQKMVHGERV